MAPPERGAPPIARFSPDGRTEAGRLYALGEGGPTSDEAIGHPELFRWRFSVFRKDGTATTLMFSSMPRLMAFTRVLNGRRAFTVPTEALRLGPGALPSVPGLSVWLDPDPSDFDALAADGPLELDEIPELEAAG